MLDARPGTIVCFERVDLYETPDQCMRHDRLTPLGYVDDGVEHAPRDMHSVRVPIPHYARRLLLDDIAVLHYSALRPTALAAKLRWYRVMRTSAALSLGVQAPPPLCHACRLHRSGSG